MQKTVDARGLACPQPVILTRRAMREEGVTEIVTIGDSETSRRNVSRMAEREGSRVAVEERGDEALLRLTRPSAAPGARGGVASASTAVGRATPAAGPSSSSWPPTPRPGEESSAAS